MKTTIKLLAVFALALAAFGQHSTANAGGSGQGHFRDLGSDAFFSSTDPSGCVVTEVGILSTEHFFQLPPGPGSEGPFTSLIITQYDICTATYLLSANGSTTEDLSYQVSKKLKGASLTATINLHDAISDTSFDAFIDLTWKGVGPSRRDNNHSHFHSPGCHINAHSNGTFRSAEVSGSISSATTNFTPDPALFASLFRVKSGNLVIGCN